jgi:hypothetical protein
MHDFFISYNGADRGWAEWIAWQLEEAGYEVVIQAWDFRPGSNFVLEMDRAANTSRCTIAVLSQNYVDALYTHPEWAAAFAQDPVGKRRSLTDDPRRPGRSLRGAGGGEASRGSPAGSGQAGDGARLPAR